jgi:hypothetical protein
LLWITPLKAGKDLLSVANARPIAIPLTRKFLINPPLQRSPKVKFQVFDEVDRSQLESSSRTKNP